MIRSLDSQMFEDTLVTLGFLKLRAGLVEQMLSWTLSQRKRHHHWFSMWCPQLENLFVRRFTTPRGETDWSPHILQGGFTPKTLQCPGRNKRTQETLNSETDWSAIQLFEIKPQGGLSMSRGRSLSRGWPRCVQNVTESSGARSNVKQIDCKRGLIMAIFFHRQRTLGTWFSNNPAASDTESRSKSVPRFSASGRGYHPQSGIVQSFQCVTQF